MAGAGCGVDLSLTMPRTSSSSLMWTLLEPIKLVTLSDESRRCLGDVSGAGVDGGVTSVDACAINHTRGYDYRTTSVLRTVSPTCAYHLANTTLLIRLNIDQVVICP